MFRLLRFVVWTLTIIAWLPIFTIRNVCAQATSTNEVRDEDQFDDRAVADRYEQILRSRPQLGSAFDKLFAFHARQKTTAELCARLELTANSSQDGKLFQLLGLFQLRLGLRVDAVSNLTRAELLLPNEPLTSVYLSRALSANRQYAAALAALKVAAERKPNQAIALEMLKELRQLE